MEPHIAHQQKTVVIIDDHPSMQRALKSVLEEDTTLNLKVIGMAADGMSGLNMVRDLHPDLIVLDLNLPHLDGLSVVWRIRQLELNTAIVVFSGLDARVYARKVMEAGCNGFISKTMEPQDIIATVRTVLAGFTCFPQISTPARTSGSDDRSIDTLTRRELAVMLGLARGSNNRQLADELHISEKTISTYKGHILQKLGLGNIVDIVNYAKMHGLVD
ncbi:MAG: response regulator transcription factor [Rhodocyclaceae bacterium]